MNENTLLNWIDEPGLHTSDSCLTDDGSSFTWVIEQTPDLKYKISGSSPELIDHLSDGLKFRIIPDLDSAKEFCEDQEREIRMDLAKANPEFLPPGIYLYSPGDNHYTREKFYVGQIEGQTGQRIVWGSPGARKIIDVWEDKRGGVSIFILTELAPMAFTLCQFSLTQTAADALSYLLNQIAVEDIPGTLERLQEFNSDYPGIIKL